MDALVEDSVAFVLASLAIMAAQWTAAALAVTLANWAAARMVSRLRWRLLSSVLRQEMAFFDTNTTLNFASALTEDMDKFRAGVGEHVVMTSYLVGSVVAGGGLSLYYGWQLTLVGLAVYQTRCSGEEVTAYGTAGRAAEEALAAIRTNIAMCHPHLELFAAARGAAASLYKLLERRSKIDAMLDRGERPDRLRGEIEPVLFSGTIRENIALGLDDVSEADIIEAATTANAHQFITKLVHGYDTMLGERGASLSGGQKQRIAIARAVLRRPAVQAALDAASKGRTTLVVSHRLSTIVNATRIAYVEHGAVLEQGSHRELLEKQGLYWRLLQEDMSTESLEQPLSEECPDDDEVVEENCFRRASSVRSNMRESLTPERCIRGSRRLGSVSAAHVPNAAAPDLINHAEPMETEEEAAEEPVSSYELLKLNAPEWPLLLGGGLASLLMFAESDPNKILARSQVYAGLFAAVAAGCGAVMGGIYLEGYVMKKAEVKEKRALEEASRVATEAVANVRTVQSLAVESRILSKYLGSLSEAAARGGGAARLRGPVYGLCLCAPTLGYAVSLGYGGVSEALIYGAWMLAEALSFAPNFAAARRSGARILRALRRAPLVVTEDSARELPDWVSAVTFSDVHFSYPTRPSAPVLRGLSLTLEAGKRLALVGASGCGKSTLIALLLRSYDTDGGCVLRAQLGLVQQEPALFERTIRDNIAGLYWDLLQQQGPC
ncbi:hypothetical protein MSG28_015530 [Choristoneura fumiferana]|uniref:Uncharacterized protein n=1 Tax=Choristoneura fumiferana TaxID=7141 RepID=A0ACC0KAJ3_CHOFU|nr:hypothetical protein MSG28_015530 [Choristoneura fumiferana]